MESVNHAESRTKPGLSGKV